MDTTIKATGITSDDAEKSNSLTSNHINTDDDFDDDFLSDEKTRKPKGKKIKKMRSTFDR